MVGLDTRRVRFHRLPTHHGADRAGVRRPDHRSNRGLLGHPCNEARRRHSLRLVGRPFGTTSAADDFDPVVFDMQSTGRALADFHLPVRDPCAAGHWNGRRMASRRGAGHGVLARPLTGIHVRRAAKILGLGFALSALAYGFLYEPFEAWHKGYGWRGMLILGVLPALACVWIRMYVKEPEVWIENKQIQNTTQRQVTLPLFAIFKRKYLFNTLTGCLWMAMNFCVYYAVWAMLGTYLQKELGWTPAEVAKPVFWANIFTFLACAFWGAVSESVGRRWALMIPMTIALFLIPLYLTQVDHMMFFWCFLLFICFFSGKDALNPGWLSERFPTEVRATASGFVYHQGAVWGAAVAPILTYFAVNQGMGFAKPMMYAVIGTTIIYIISVYLGPETKGKVMTADLEVIEAAGN